MARILVVDDQKISRLTLAGILGEADHSVRVEASGPEGLNAARSWLPDVIILDVHMPEMDGFAVVERLKRDPLTESIPVIFLTGDPPTDELIVRGLRLGAYDFLSKGCSKAELLARVGVMEQIKRSHDEMSAIARISDALLQSVEPEALAHQFIREARKIFRADAIGLVVRRNGRERVRAHEGPDLPEGLDALIAAMGQGAWDGGHATARFLDDDATADLVAPYVQADFRAAAVASVAREPSRVLLVLLARAAGAFREDVDGPLLKTLSSQAAMALDRALLNQRARRQARDLERAITERSRFFASLSHELRTPINAVIGYNHLLQEKIFGDLSDRQMDALRKANRSAQHLLELVDDILDISKIEAGKLQVFPEQVELAGLLRDTATSLQLQAREKGIYLDMDTPDALVVTTDPARVRQIVLNLLSNAVKFTEEGGVTVALSVAAGEDDAEMVEVRVSDTGPGIRPEDQDRIFDEFEQVGRAAGPGGTGPSGTGLGLAISRRLAELLGGTVRLESEPGAGSAFTLTLPSGNETTPAR